MFKKEGGERRYKMLKSLHMCLMLFVRVVCGGFRLLFVLWKKKWSLPQQGTFHHSADSSNALDAFCGCAVSVSFFNLVLPIVVIPLNHQAYANMQRKIEAVMNAPRLQDMSQLQSFLGFVNNYIRFMAKFSYHETFLKHVTTVGTTVGTRV